MYTGPAITPLEYYFNLHTLTELSARSALGFIKMTFSMPRSFAEGKGNLLKIQYIRDCFKKNFSFRCCSETFRWLSDLSTSSVVNYCLAILLSLSLVAGIVLLIINRQFFICSCLVTFQFHTAFIASFGIDQRLTVHAYPVTALCCAYALYCIGLLLHQKILLPFVHCRQVKT